MILAGLPLSAIKKQVAEKDLKEALDEIVIPSAEIAVKMNIERLSFLVGKLMTAAQGGDESAVNSIVKILQVQQQMILEYREFQPDEKTQLEQFRERKEAQKNKNSRKYKK